MGKIKSQAKSKLAGMSSEDSAVAENDDSEPTGMMDSSRKRQIVSKTFRFTLDDVQSLKDITTRVNSESR